MPVRRYDSPGQARFVTFSCYQRLPLLGDSRTRDAFAERLEAERVRLGFSVIAWVVMPEHVHLVIVPVDGALGPVLRGVKQGFSRMVLDRWRERSAPVFGSLVDPRGVTRFWQRGGGYDRNIRDQKELVEKIRYTHENPVRRGLVQREEDWAWSSARDYRGGKGVVEIWRGW
jgi:putative transposase